VRNVGTVLGQENLLRVSERQVVFSDEIKRGKNFLSSNATGSISGAKNESG